MKTLLAFVISLIIVMALAIVFKINNTAEEFKEGRCTPTEYYYKSRGGNLRSIYKCEGFE